MYVGLLKRIPIQRQYAWMLHRYAHVHTINVWGCFHLLWKIFKLVTFIPPTHHLVIPSIMTMYTKYLLIWTTFRTCANHFYFCCFDSIVNAVITREVAAALDRTNLSDRKAAHFICKTFQTGCGRNYHKSNAIQRARMKHPEVFVADVQVAFKPLMLY